MGRPISGTCRTVLIAAGLTIIACDARSGDADAPTGSGGAESSGAESTGSLAVAGASSEPGDSLVASDAALDSGAEVYEPAGYELQLNPYGNCPLVAVVNVHGIQESDVERIHVVVAGQGGGTDFERQYVPSEPAFAEQLDTSDLTFEEAGVHVPLLGLYADADSAVQLSAELVDGGRVELALDITTQLQNSTQAAWLPDIQVNTAMVEQMEPGWTVSELSIEPNPPPPVVLVNWTRTLAFDSTGAVRWALLPDFPAGETFTLTRSLRGNIWTGSFDTIVELSKLGRTLRSFQLTGHSIHHEIVQIGAPDAHGSLEVSSAHGGNLLVLASQNGASTIQDHILELDAETGELLNDWDLGSVFDPTRTTYVDPERFAPGAGDWLHANGLTYSSHDESIVVSGRNQGVAKIRRDGTLVWLLAPHAGWQEPQAEKLLTAVDASGVPYEDTVQQGSVPAGDVSGPEFGWAFGQHSPVLLSNGDLLLFDNGASRHFGPICGNYSRAVIYRIDEDSMTVRQVAQFVLPRAESSCFVSNTHPLPQTGNFFIQPGSTFFETGRSIAVVKEVATRTLEDGNIAFEQVVFDARLDMSVIPSSSLSYSYRGHRWLF